LKRSLKIIRSIKYKGLNYLLLAIFLFCSLAIVVEKSSIVDEYTLGEWLINYSAGFVRRGISGSLILNVSDALNIKPLLFLNSSLLVLFLTNLSLVGLILGSLTLSQTYWLLFSPALFLMIPTDTMARKENLFFFLLLLHVLLVHRKSLWLNQFQKYALPILGLVISFSHEIYVFFLPFHLLLVLLNPLSSAQKRKVFLLNLLPLVGLFAAMLFPGSYPLRDLMCKSLVEFSIPCKGGIEAIGMSAQVSAAHSLLVLKDVYSVQSYVLDFGLTNLVTLWLFSSSVSFLLNNKLGKMLIFSNLAFPLVCLMGWDIGRWISLFSIHNFFILFAVPQDEKKQDLNSGEDFIKSLSLGFFLILISLFLNNKYRAQYDRVNYPVTESRVPSFLHIGLNWWVNKSQFNSYAFGKKIKFSIPINETITSDDTRLYFLEWSEPQPKGRWSRDSRSSIIFSLKGNRTDLKGKIKLSVGTPKPQRMKCFLNGEKIYDGLLEPKQSILELNFKPQILKTKVNEHKLDFIFPEQSEKNDGASQSGNVFVESISVH
jgi:hypothetical protein